jgi:hypothetical protein
VRRKGLRTTTEIVGFVKDWEIIADNLSKAGFSWGCVSVIDSSEQTTRLGFPLKSVVDMRHIPVYKAYVVRFRHPTVSLNLRHRLNKPQALDVR